MTRRPPARLLLPAALALCALPPREATADVPAPVELNGFSEVQGLRFADADEDGIQDLMLVMGREVRVWRGVKGGPIRTAPTWIFTLPGDATYAWPGRTLEGSNGAKAPTLLALGRGGALRLRPGLPPVVEEGLRVALRWADPARGVLTDFVRGTNLLLPYEFGWQWVPDWIGARARAFDLAVPPKRKVASPGAFLEEGAVVTWEWPAPTLVPSWAPTGGPAAFVLGDDGLHAFSPKGDDAVQEAFWPTTFLPPVGDGRVVLADLDGDGTPDVCHEATTNDSGTYTFFRTPPPAALGMRARGGRVPAPAGDLRPARGKVKLSGFQFPPDYADLDGDGRRDMAITTIDIDASNIRRAIMQGRVVAKTRAFLNRSKAGAGEFFGAPDAEVDSDILVKLRFTYSGSIEVKRSFTILPTADLDGDGKKDLVIRTSPDTLAVRRGIGAGVWSEEPRTVAIPPMGKSPDLEAYAADLTGDGKDDLVLLYRAPPGGSDTIFFLQSP